jgi:hypothetical protein
LNTLDPKQAKAPLGELAWMTLLLPIGEKARRFFAARKAAIGPFRRSRRRKIMSEIEG